MLLFSYLEWERRKTWKYCELFETPNGEGNSKKSYVCTRCKFCYKVYKGGVKKQKNHHAETHKNVGLCIKVPDNVK